MHSERGRVSLFAGSIGGIARVFPRVSVSGRSDAQNIRPAAYFHRIDAHHVGYFLAVEIPPNYQRDVSVSNVAKQLYILSR